MRVTLKSVTIKPATNRDVSWIAANVNPDDFKELECQLDAYNSVLVTKLCLQDKRHTYVAYYKGIPAAAFGASEGYKGNFTAWAFSTPEGLRCYPEITRFIKGVIGPEILADGCQSISAYSLASHKKAHQWLLKIGLRPIVDLPCHGKRGENFKLFRATKDDWHVLIKTKSATCNSGSYATRRRSAA